MVQAATGIRLPLPRGRGLGGSSSINAMVFARGHRASYDAWVAAGATGWGSADLLPHFRRSEHTENRDPVVRGVGGPVIVGPADPPNPVVAAGLAAAIEVGHAKASDVSSGMELGFGLTDLSIVNGRRWSAVDAYLAPALGRPNLEVVTNALVHRVTLDQGRCTGVEYSVGAEKFTSWSTGEVVVTAGAIGSPQLLMQSGIGPRSHLREVGVDVVVDLPGVGENLQDHPTSCVIYSAAQPVPAGTNGHDEAIGLVCSNPALEGPDLQISIVDFPYAPELPNTAAGGYSIMFALMTPRSRGTVRLTSHQSDAAPAIDPNYYSNPHDLDVMVAGLRMAREIGRADALAPWRRAEVLPGPAMQDEESLRAFLRTNLSTYFHYAGTCRIGEDDMAVVDTELRVHGVSRLRVADASVMPTIVSANTNATVYAIAERAATLIAGRVR